MDMDRKTEYDKKKCAGCIYDKKTRCILRMTKARRSGKCYTTIQDDGLHQTERPERGE